MAKELCKCGHAKNEHVAFWKPATGVKKYCWCDCENFCPTKRAPDVAKSGEGKNKISGKRPARSPRR